MATVMRENNWLIFEKWVEITKNESNLNITVI